MKPISLKCGLLMLATMSVLSGAGKDMTVKSPDGQLTATLRNTQNTMLSISRNGQEVMTFTDIAVTANGKTYGNGRVAKVARRKGNETFSPVVPLKFSEIKSCYNEAVVRFDNGAGLVVRVMDNAVAYRWQLPSQAASADQLIVADERLMLAPAEGLMAHIQPCGSFNTSYEDAYRHLAVSEWKAQNGLATLPALFSATDGSDLQVLVGESDVTDYPHMFLRGSEAGIAAVFPPYPEVWEPRGDRGENITTEADYIACRENVSSEPAALLLPWRWAIVTDSRGLVEQTVPLQLSRRSLLDETSWIRPGKVSWEWWNGAVPYGPDVDFVAGNNYETYRYFIDFAAHYGIEYILLDEGWAQSTRDPFTEKPGLRLHDLIAYSKERGVGLLLWLPWLTVEQHFDLFARYAEWGVAGVKIDFMDHADQWMNGFYRRVAAEAARHKLLVDFHGSFSPAGLEHEYPNVISYEGVRGLEQMGGCRPENTTFLPFMRNAVGAADFTPGGMFNMQPDRYRSERPNSGAMGTRVFQMALYVVLESGVQMLADNPTLYYRNDDCTRFIASVPVTWDETRCLAAEAGSYVVVARRKADQWFVGAICDGQQEERTFSLPLDFLASGRVYTMTAYSDGLNANRQAMDYKRGSTTVTSDSTVDIHLARNGGWAAVIK
ncbi:MAG: glycoside hydrolase family 97 protein [Bacteroidaceae bacterium]|nr:glycoside hydrolase family 97 protein [Bacteroidaceae bacterium]